MEFSKNETKKELTACGAFLQRTPIHTVGNKSGSRNAASSNIANQIEHLKTFKAP